MSSSEDTDGLCDRRKEFFCQLTLPGLITYHLNGEKKFKNAMASASISDQLIKHLTRDARIHPFLPLNVWWQLLLDPWDLRYSEPVVPDSMINTSQGMPEYSLSVSRGLMAIASLSGQDSK